MAEHCFYETINQALLYLTRRPVRAREGATLLLLRPAALPAIDLEDLEAQARYHRDRLALYRARVLSANPTSAGRLRELQRISTAADARLRHAQDAIAPTGPAT